MKKIAGRKEKEKKIRGVFWGASQSEVKNSEKWTQIDSHDRYYLCYVGIIRGHQCRLNYFFDDHDGEKLTQVEYYIRVIDGSDNDSQEKTRALCDWLEKVLVENYGDKAENYKGHIWVIHDEETVIELNHAKDQSIYRVTVIMKQNPKDVHERKTDYYKQALREL